MPDKMMLQLGNFLVSHPIKNKCIDRPSFRLLIETPCFYCGQFSQAVCKTHSIRGRVDSIMYNGIDRVDNSIGYQPSNCVACCSTCNRLKHTLRQKEFLDKIVRIYLNRIANHAQEKGINNDRFLVGQNRFRKKL